MLTSSQPKSIKPPKDAVRIPPKRFLLIDAMGRNPSYAPSVVLTVSTTDEDLCIGCGDCVKACALKARKLEKTAEDKLNAARKMVATAEAGAASEAGASAEAGAASEVKATCESKTASMLGEPDTASMLGEPVMVVAADKPNPTNEAGSDTGASKTGSTTEASETGATVETSETDSTTVADDSTKTEPKTAVADNLICLACGVCLDICPKSACSLTTISGKTFLL